MADLIVRQNMNHAELPIYHVRLGKRANRIWAFIAFAVFAVKARYSINTLEWAIALLWLAMAIIFWREKPMTKIISFRWAGDFIEFTAPKDPKFWIRAEWIKEDGVSYCFIGPLHRHHVYIPKDSIPLSLKDSIMMKNEPNKALEPTIMAVTDCAPSSTLRASHDRGSV
jgi:hypothetical protein